MKRVDLIRTIERFGCVLVQHESRHDYDGGATLELKHGLISVDDHVQEHPEVWTQRLSRSKWGDRIPHIESQPDGTESWVVDGEKIPLAGVASAGAAMPDRALEPQRWEEVPRSAYVPSERLKAMDTDGVDYSVLYPTVAGYAGETFGQLKDEELELACVQAYNDWIIEEWAGASHRFIPQCIVPISPIDATIAEVRRAVAKGHRGVVFPAIPMHLRDVPHINEPDYDPLWETCSELQVPVCFHSGSSPQIQFPAYDGLSPGLGLGPGSPHPSGEHRYSHSQLPLLSHPDPPPGPEGRVCRKLLGMGRIRDGDRRPPV